MSGVGVNASSGTAKAAAAGWSALIQVSESVVHPGEIEIATRGGKLHHYQPSVGAGNRPHSLWYEATHSGQGEAEYPSRALALVWPIGGWPVVELAGSVFFVTE